MSRPLKDGADYFPLDVDFFDDKKIKLIRNKHGSDGMYFVVFMLCSVYKEKYYIQWDKDSAMLISEDMKYVNAEDVQSILNTCLDVGLFSKELFEKYNILTSRGIQKRHVRMFSKRNSLELISEYLLLDVENENDMPKSYLQKIKIISLTGVSVYGNEQSKVKESKEKESKAKESKEKIMPEAEAACGQEAEQEEKEAFQLPLNDKTVHRIYAGDIKHYRELYPSVNVEQEIRNMQGWCEVNPTKLKTGQGIKKFINNWLKKQQDKASCTGTDFTGKKLYNVPESKPRSVPSYDIDEYLKRALNLKNELKS